MPIDRAELMDRWNATLPDQAAIGIDLIRRYDEPHRRYHTTEHLRYVLTMIDELADDRHDAWSGWRLVPRCGLRHPAGPGRQRGGVGTARPSSSAGPLWSRRT